MKVRFDQKKDAVNRHKHGLSLQPAEALCWPDVRCKPDTRRDYGEVREIGYGVIDSRVYCVVFTQRGDTIHIISFRKANSREVALYVDQTQGHSSARPGRRCLD